MRQRDSGSKVLRETRSICPHCKRVVDAEIFSRDGRVYMRKRCPEHGWAEALIFGDAALWREATRVNKPGRPAREFATAVAKGCPLDCGLCPDHQQHACMSLLEITSDCDLRCPLCFADAGRSPRDGGFELSVEQVDFMLERLIRAEGHPEVVQLSGGEPTLHPHLLDLVELAQRKGVEHVVVNTNGLRLAHDDALVTGLARLRARVNLQFDGLDPATNLALRGRADLVGIKLRTLDRLAEAGVWVVLVAAIERGVNEHEVGPIVELGLRHPAVFGINFQPVFRAQRHLPADPLERVTVPDVLRAMEAQTKGLFTVSDFVPVPCCAPTCNFVTYALLDGDAVTPIPRVVDVGPHLGYLQNRTIPAIGDDLVRLLERLWSASATVGSGSLASGVKRLVMGGLELTPAGRDAARLARALGDPARPTSLGRAVDRCPACQAQMPLGTHSPTDLARHIFMISVREFMDAWTFDVQDVMRCCFQVLIPDGRIIPFCAYNSAGYREAVTAGAHDRVVTVDVR